MYLGRDNTGLLISPLSANLYRIKYKEKICRKHVFEYEHVPQCLQV